jgi:CHAT domain-containing protein/Flp pilus assembly protein TadD
VIKHRRATARTHSKRKSGSAEPSKRRKGTLEFFPNEKAKKPRLSAAILSALSDMSDDQTLSAFLQRRKLFCAESVLELNAATQKEFRISSKKATSLANAAILVARAIRRNELVAQSYRVKANVLAASGEYQASVGLYDAALSLFEKAADPDGTARTLMASIQPQIMLGAYDKAFEAAEKAKIILLELGDERRLARLDNNVGNIYHRQDRFDEALTHYLRAYQLLLPRGDTEELSISLNNISMCLITMNDFDQALATYQRAKEMLRGRDLPLILLITDYNIAYLHYLRGDYRHAIEMLKAARKAAEQIKYFYLVALCYLDLSEIYVELNLSAEVHDIAVEGLALFQKLNIGYEAAKILANEAIALGQEGKSHAALELFAQAKPLFVREKNEVWPWLIDLYQAIVLFQEGRHYEARRLALAAAGFFDNSLMKNKAVLCHLLLAQISMRTSGPSEARAECLRAFEVLSTVDAPILRYQGHFLLGQIEQAEGNARAAYEEYQRARAQLESLRSSLSRDELKVSFMKNKIELYERLVELCLSEELECTSNEEAFQYVELAKSRSLVEMIFQRSTALSVEKAGQSGLVHRLRDLREELNWYQHRIELEQLRPERNSAERIQQLHIQAEDRERALLKALAELPEASAAAAPMPLQQCVPLERIREVIPADTSLVEYFFTGEQVLAMVLTGQKLEIVPVTTVSRISDPLRMFRFQLGRFQLNSGRRDLSSEAADQATMTHLKTLYEELIAPIRMQLNRRHLVVVPHGILHYLPFHALHDGTAFLADSFAFSYSPSASVFALCHTRESRPSGGALILGVPDAQAPLIQDEVESIHRTLPGSELFVGADANHDLLLRKGQSSALIHIATHGKFRPDNPMFSGIRLGDGYLHLYEFFHMRLSAELVALSGCATGLNLVAAGDELLGLIRGTLFAGARSLLLTLWDVHDRSTARFMTSFYRCLQRSPSKAEALAEASRELRDEYPHPYYWAPFLIVGKALSTGFAFKEPN